MTASTSPATGARPSAQPRSGVVSYIGWNPWDQTRPRLHDRGRPSGRLRDALRPRAADATRARRASWCARARSSATWATPAAAPASTCTSSCAAGARPSTRWRSSRRCRLRARHRWYPGGSHPSGGAAQHRARRASEPCSERTEQAPGSTSPGACWRRCWRSLLVLSFDAAMAPPAQAGSASVAAAIRARQLKAEATHAPGGQADQAPAEAAPAPRQAAQGRQATSSTWPSPGATPRDDKGSRVAAIASATAEDVLGRTLRVHPDPTGRPDRRQARRCASRSASSRPRLRTPGEEGATAGPQGGTRHASAKQARQEGRRRPHRRAQGGTRARRGQARRVHHADAGALQGARRQPASARPRSKGFRKPAKGTITPGLRLHRLSPPTRGVARAPHFHDGIDIAAPARHQGPAPRPTATSPTWAGTPGTGRRALRRHHRPRRRLRDRSTPTSSRSARSGPASSASSAARSSAQSA